MKIFYWVMGLLILATFVPSALSLLMYGVTGDDVHARRASSLWAYTKSLGLFGFNVLIWGHVLVALWQIGFQ